MSWWALALLATAASATAAPGEYASFESAPVHALDVSPDGQRIALVHTAAAELIEFRWHDGQLAIDARLPTGLEPVSVRFRSATEAWVVSPLGDAVGVYDLKRDQLLRIVATADTPTDVVFAGSPQRAYVATETEPALWRYDPARPQAPPERIALQMPEPRTLATDGGRVYALSYRSGNASTVLAGAFVDRLQLARLRNVTQRPEGPYRGQSPPLPGGASLAAALAPAPPLGLIVQRDAEGHWRDDLGGDWTRFVSGDLASMSGRTPGWTVPDRDLAILDTEDDALRYESGLLTHGLALAVGAEGPELAGMQARNLQRHEPRLRGNFLRHQWLRVGAEARSERDLNQGQRADHAAADVRALLVVGDTRYLAAQGSNRLLRLDAAGQRIEPAILELPAGPAALALAPGGRHLLVWSRFAATLSVVELKRYQVVQTLVLADPTPAEVRAGRPWLYEARRSSANGTQSCAGCHLDARTDRLAWDLGDPGGTRTPFAGNCLTSSGKPCPDWHPLKGPLLTQSLTDIVGHEPLHWRGDRQSLNDFARTFTGLMGRKQAPDAAEFDQLRSFLASVRPWPNRFRGLDDRLPRKLDLAHVPGVGAAREGDWPAADAIAGLSAFRTAQLALPFQCVSCHTLPAGYGAARGIFAGGAALPPGPHGATRLGLSSLAGISHSSFKVAPLRELHQRLDPSTVSGESWTGLGFAPDGSLLTLADYLRLRGFRIVQAQDEANVLAWLLSFGGVDGQPSASDDTREPRGVAVQQTHAAVGQWLVRPPGATESAAVRTLIDEAAQRRIELRISLGTKAQARSCLLFGEQCTGADGSQSTLAALRERHPDRPWVLLALPVGLGAWLQTPAQSE